MVDHAPAGLKDVALSYQMPPTGGSSRPFHAPPATIHLAWKLPFPAHQSSLAETTEGLEELQQLEPTLPLGSPHWGPSRVMARLHIGP